MRSRKMRGICALPAAVARELGWSRPLLGRSLQAASDFSRALVGCGNPAHEAGTRVSPVSKAPFWTIPEVLAVTALENQVSSCVSHR